MKTCSLVVLMCAAGLTLPALGQSSLSPELWSVRLDLGGNIPENPSLRLHDGFVTGGDKMELDAGVQFSAALGYRVVPWLILEGELGFSYNGVKAVGNFTYPDTALTQFTMMANLVIEPPTGPLVPFAGIGAGGVVSTLTFGNYYSYYYGDSDGHGTDFVPAAQAFAGLRYKFGERTSLGVSYRFLVTEHQKWDVNWYTGNDFTVSVDSMRTHLISLEFSASF
jgi:opacity protein-like surface antigen